ncbi:MAG: hypothetical protein M1838_005464 [Thelocarpon superellum]|nr:MAG: hypothetical protein M1838_005464 [Thelocarpon superellum]
MEVLRPDDVLQPQVHHRRGSSRTSDALSLRQLEQDVFARICCTLALRSDAPSPSPSQHGGDVTVESGPSNARPRDVVGHGPRQAAAVCGPESPANTGQEVDGPADSVDGGEEATDLDASRRVEGDTAEAQFPRLPRKATTYSFTHLGFPSPRPWARFPGLLPTSRTAATPSDRARAGSTPAISNASGTYVSESSLAHDEGRPDIPGVIDSPSLLPTTAIADPVVDDNNMTGDQGIGEHPPPHTMGVVASNSCASSCYEPTISQRDSSVQPDAVENAPSPPITPARTAEERQPSEISTRGQIEKWIGHVLHQSPMSDSPSHGPRPSPVSDDAAAPMEDTASTQKGRFLGRLFSSTDGNASASAGASTEAPGSVEDAGRDTLPSQDKGKSPDRSGDTFIVALPTKRVTSLARSGVSSRRGSRADSTASLRMDAGGVPWTSDSQAGEGPSGSWPLPSHAPSEPNDKDLLAHVATQSIDAVAQPASSRPTRPTRTPAAAQSSEEVVTHAETWPRADYMTARAGATPPMGLASPPEHESPPPSSHIELSVLPASVDPQAQSASRRGRLSPFRAFSLRDRHHVDIRESRRFRLSHTHRRKPIARDWDPARKRCAAAVACVNTALIGLIIGIYAGEVPAIQYQVVDEHHRVILGNVLLYIGLAVPTISLWTLPLLHGRKPYTLVAFSVFLPLQLPQAIVVMSERLPSQVGYLVALLLSRFASGLALGLANMNLKGILLDLFGSSLQSGNPHQEVVPEHDYRRHGGGMGIWLGIWSWCFIGSLGVGFFFGALVISSLNPSWGFWISVMLTTAVLLLNVIMPETRRSSYRRSTTEVRRGSEVARRVARGEVKMHVYSTGPKWWWEEVLAGLVLSGRMLGQPGFAVLSFYVGWVYAQIVMVMILLGALTSRYYQFRSTYVGLCVAAIPIGALAAVPFQKASLFSRARKNAPRTDSMTFQKRVTWSSHLVRRAVFMIALPFADLAYTLSSGGPPTPFMWPTFFAGLIGFLSSLAIAEGCGLIMETYDTCDLQPGMTGRRSVPESTVRDPRRTNFSCFPRVSAGLAITETWGFLIAAAATGVGGTVERRLGTEVATGVMAAILLVLTILLVLVLWRHREVEVVPVPRPVASDVVLPEEDWTPVIIGNPSGRMRRMSLLELGSLSRWTEIRRRNRLLSNAGTGAP